jgi:D-serine deaminase-like pyridoxal phosphate-dependent protein
MSAVLPEVATPALVVDARILEENIRSMAERAGRHGVRLRPHAKTHKSLEIARRQRDAGATGLTVATVSEAEVFAGAGFTDLFIAYPLWADPAKGRRLRSLAERGDLSVGIDSAEGARALAAQLGAASEAVRVLVEVDSGHHRTGVAPRAAGVLADRARHAGLRVEGVFTFPGHSYAPGEREKVARQEAAALAEAAEALTSHGVAPAVLSGGSTPTAQLVESSAMTEMRPGVYVFGDAQQLELGTVAPTSVALTALATVVSHSCGQVVLDAGSKVLGADRAPWATGFGRLLDHPDARITGLSEHLAVVAWGEDGPLPDIGSRLRVVPNHCCTAVNLADELVVCADGAAADRWPVTARGANT